MKQDEFRDSLEEYGEYMEFDHKPTEAEVDAAVLLILHKLMPHIQKRALIKRHILDADGGALERWTVGLKVLLYKK